MPKLQCNISKLFYGVNTNRHKELIEQYGSLDNLESTYISRDAKRLLKEGKTEAEIRQMAINGTLTSKTSPPKKYVKQQAKNGGSAQSKQLSEAIAKLKESQSQSSNSNTTKASAEPKVLPIAEDPEVAKLDPGVAEFLS